TAASISVRQASAGAGAGEVVGGVVDEVGFALGTVARVVVGPGPGAVVDTVGFGPGGFVGRQREHEASEPASAVATSMVAVIRPYRRGRAGVVVVVIDRPP